MKELSLNILDIAQNSVKARARHITITIEETEKMFSFSIGDDGCGMQSDFLAHVTDPFTTTRTTRKVGLGLPLLKMEAEMTGGSFSITSKSENECEEHGTTVTASFCKDSVDFIPLGDIVGTLGVLIQGLDGISLNFRHTTPGGEVVLSTEELQSVLGDVPLSTPEVMIWIRDYLTEQYAALI